MKQLAEKYHTGQYRKGEGRVPYIVHPEAVVNTLIMCGVPLDSPIIQIAWGHDLLEDTKVTGKEIIEVSDESVYRAICMLTKPERVSKSLYLRAIARKGLREVILVKAADRICNTKDFVKLEGELSAYRYLHQAEVLLPALEKIADDPVANNLLQMWKALDASLEKIAFRDAARGCLLGGAIGDALGSPVEFLNKEDIIDEYGKDGVTSYVEHFDGTGRITDDTQMTLFTAEGILRAEACRQQNRVSRTEDMVHYAYLRWLKTQGETVNCDTKIIESGGLIKEKSLYSCRAPGITCISALKCVPVGSSANNNSKGCGTVMRLAPAGIFYEPETAYEMGCKFSAITHGHPTGIIAGGTFAMLISLLYRGKGLEESLIEIIKKLRNIPEASETLAAIQAARSAEDISELGEGWIAEEALAIAVYCSLHHQYDFMSGVLAAVNITGDSDSAASLTGNILGVINGEKAIPEKWKINLREHSIVEQIAEDLCTKYQPDSEWQQKYPAF